MTKLLGAILLVSAAGWCWWSRLRQQRQRRAALSALTQALGFMETAIRWHQRPMIPLLSELAQRPLCGKYFAVILQNVQSERPLHISWKKATALLEDTEAAQLLQAMEMSGDTQHLLRQLQYAQQQLRHLAERRAQDDIRDRRLTGAALFSAAGLLVILLI